MYSQRVVGWMKDPELRGQLPLEFGAFARFCMLQSNLWDPVVGGHLALKAAMYIHRTVAPGEPVAVQRGPLKIYLDAGDPRMLQVPNEVFGVSAVGTAVDTLLKPGDTFLDVGANHGSFSLRAARAVGEDGLVLAFEPQPTLARLLRRSLGESCTTPFDVIEVACSDVEGRESFYVPTDSSGSAGLFQSFSGAGPQTTLEVRTARLDDLLPIADLPGRIVMKLDVEGAESRVLAGAERLLATRRPHLIMEVNPHTLQASETHRDNLIGTMAGLGYRAFLEVGDLDAAPVPLKQLDSNTHHNILLLGAE